MQIQNLAGYRILTEQLRTTMVQQTGRPGSPSFDEIRQSFYTPSPITETDRHQLICAAVRFHVRVHVQRVLGGVIDDDAAY